MKNNLVALVSGIIFGIGLCISRMVNPQVIIDFVDVTGNWDPSLAFVMAGGLTFSLISFRLVLKRQRPVCSEEFAVPTSQMVDKPLILGAVLFGIGWGMAGICPGPAITGLAFGLPKFYVFAASMIAGMGIYRLSQK